MKKWLFWGMVMVLILIIFWLRGDRGDTNTGGTQVKEGVNQIQVTEEIELPRDYFPYQAELPPELEGKLVLEYNYGFDPEGENFLIKRKWTILSRIEHIQLHEVVLDGNGNDISTVLVPADGPETGNTLYYAFGIGPFDPGETPVVYGTTTGMINSPPSTPLDSWRVEERVIYFRLP